jgi:amino acid adenylation domain-containing protein
LWFLYQLHPSGSAYHRLFAHRLKGPLNVAALEQSLNEIVRRHQVLRTIFKTVDERPLQAIVPTFGLPLPVVDLRELPASEREVEVQRLSAREAQRPFDLACGPLLRAVVLQLCEKEHALLLTTHSIVFDRWSAGVFNRELAAFYAACSTGEASQLPGLALRYVDYAVWQREWLQDKTAETQLAYWKRQLGDSPPVLELPTDRPRPPDPTFRGARHFFTLSQELREALEALSQREGVTLFVTLLAAFKTLLFRYTGQTVVVVGSPIANRNRAGTKDLIGRFANILVLRCDLSGGPTFRELLVRVRETILGAYAHQDLPFERLVEELQPERTLSYHPLFQVVFELQDSPAEAFGLPGLVADSLEANTRAVQFDWNLILGDTEHGMLGHVEYSTDLFDELSIERLVGHYQTLLAGIVANPDQRLSILPLLTNAEQDQLLVEWNNSQMPYRQDRCIQCLFEEQVERTPDAVALVCPSAGFGQHPGRGEQANRGEDQHLTHFELNRRANQLARYLQSLRVGPEVPVAISVERSLEMVVGILGVLKAGGAYLPLDPSYPRERLAFMLQDAQASILLTQKRLLDAWPDHRAAQVVCLDEDWAKIEQEKAENLACRTLPDHPAYVIYTSGSTGTPKGVLSLHRGAINRFHWMWETYPFGADEVCCQKTALSFADSVWEIWGPLSQGVRTVIVPDAVLKDPPRLVETLAAHHVTRIVVVPSLLREILEAFDDLQERLPELRIWVTSGEALSEDLARRFRERMPQGHLLNLYGSSEVSADATWYDTLEDDLLSCIPIGRPIANTQVYVLDRFWIPVPVGVPGELYVGGDGLARGYLKRPDMTAERFIPNPFAHPGRFKRGRGERLYRTGDLARYRPDGNVEFLGRVDHQVKMRGFRIELGEVETVLETCPSVQQAVVVAAPAAWDDERRLVAYVVPAGAHLCRSAAQGEAETKEKAAVLRPTSLISDLRNYLKARLPDYMVPATFVPLETLPLTPSGKVNRRALPTPIPTRLELDEVFVAPRTPTEKTLADVWTQVLGIKRVGVHDDFFDLGGHSLLATRIASRIRNAFQIELSLRQFLELPTVAHVAKSIEVIQQVTQDLAATPRALESDDDEYEKGEL